MNSKKTIMRSSIRSAKLARLIAKAVDLFIVLILSVFFYPVGLLLGCFYLGISDSFNGGQSVGKRLIGFNVISLEDGSPCSYKQSVIRNLPFLVPLGLAIIPAWGWLFCAFLALPLSILEVYLLFAYNKGGKRLGDVMADTTVIANDSDHQKFSSPKQSWFDSEKPAIS